MEQKTTKLYEMYTKGKFEPALKEGTYQTVLKSHEYVAEHDYIRLNFEVIEGENKGRILNENRFVKGFPIMISHLRQQLKREDETIEPIPFLNELVTNKTPITIWVTKVLVNGSQKTNLNFIAPIIQETVVPTVEESTEDDIQL